MGFSPEQLVRIIRWRLGIPVDQDQLNLLENWTVLSSSPNYKDFASKVAKSIADILESGIRIRLNLSLVSGGSKEDIAFFDSLCASFAQWVFDESKRSLRVARRIDLALSRSLPAQIYGGAQSSFAGYGRPTPPQASPSRRPSKEELGKAIRWKIGIPVEPASDRTQAVWASFVSDPNYVGSASEVAQSIADMLGEVVRYKLDLLAESAANREDLEHLDSLWSCFVQWLYADNARKLPRFHGEITRAVTRKTPSAVPTPYQQASKVATEMYTAASKLLQDRFLSPRDEKRSDQREYATSKSGAVTKSPLDIQPKAYKFPDLTGAPDASPQARRTDATTATTKVPDIRAPVVLDRENKVHPSPLTHQKPLVHQNVNPASVEPEAPAPISPSAPQAAKTEMTPPVAAEWKCLPIPEGPDKHPEFDAKAMDSSEGFRLIAARARGKKHKHDGTNCDDWFHFTSSGDWTIIAVSDGAGSKKFSRVGARAACEAAVAQLASQLENHKISYRYSWTAETFKRDEATGSFAEEDLETVQKALHSSMQKACDAVETAAAERHNSVDHFQVLGRRVDTSDLSATLLLAVHTNVKVQNGTTSLVFSCSIGDGMIAAIDKNGVSRLLMTPDSGQFSGEVTFLARKEAQPDRLRNRTFVFFGTIRALMLMSDGVADDYFPNDPGMSRLYGDLVLNQIITIKGIQDSDVTTALQKTKLIGQDELTRAEFHSIVETLTDKNPVTVRLRSTTSYSEKLDVPLADVIASPALLVAGSQGEPMCDETLPEEKLRVWLDSYQVRGSFDDRTMVVLYREVLS